MLELEKHKCPVCKSKALNMTIYDAFSEKLHDIEFLCGRKISWNGSNYIVPINSDTVSCLKNTIENLKEHAIENAEKSLHEKINKLEEKSREDELRKHDLDSALKITVDKNKVLKTEKIDAFIKIIELIREMQLENKIPEFIPMSIGGKGPGFLIDKKDKLAVVFNAIYKKLQESEEYHPYITLENKLPKYKDNGESFVPGKDEAWIWRETSDWNDAIDLSYYSVKWTQNIKDKRIWSYTFYSSEYAARAAHGVFRCGQCERGIPEDVEKIQCEDCNKLLCIKCQKYIENSCYCTECFSI